MQIFHQRSLFVLKIISRKIKMENKNVVESRFSDSGYIFSMIGSAVGFANILSFSARCYRNGGGAFLIPFVLAMIVIGIPVLCLEGLVGQYFQSPLVSAYGRVSGKSGKFFAWLAVIACATIGAFYIVLTAWSVIYTYFAATLAIPEDTGVFFQQAFLRDSGNIANLGEFSFLIFSATVLISVFTWFVLVRKIQDGIESICSLFMPLLSILTILFSLIVCFLPGAFQGFYYYLYPDFSKLWNFDLWREVFGHVFFSFSLGLGIVVGYSRYTRKETNIARAMFCVAMGDFFISLIAGFAIFGCIGFMSHSSGIAIGDIVRSDSTFEMGFVVFPMILKSFSPHFSAIIGCLFFFCVFIAGITGVFSIVESVAGNIEIEFIKTRRTAVAIAIVGMTLFSIPFCMGNGIYILAAMEPMVLGNNMLIGGIAEIFVFMYLTKHIRDHNSWIRSGGGRSYSFYSIRYFVPIILFSILAGSLFSEICNGFHINEMLRWGWFISACGLSMILANKGVVSDSLEEKTPNLKKDASLHPQLQSNL